MTVLDYSWSHMNLNWLHDITQQVNKTLLYLMFLVTCLACMKTLLLNAAASLAISWPISSLCGSDAVSICEKWSGPKNALSAPPRLSLKNVYRLRIHYHFLNMTIWSFLLSHRVNVLQIFLHNVHNGAFHFGSIFKYPAIHWSEGFILCKSTHLSMALLSSWLLF